MAAPSKLLWRCRRGMREMDMLFMRFLEEDYDQLPADGQALFARFIEETDADILSWITGRAEPAVEAYLPFVERFRVIQTPTS